MEGKKKLFLSRRLSLLAKLGGGTALLVILVVAFTAGTSLHRFEDFLQENARRNATLAVHGLANILESKREDSRMAALFLTQTPGVAEDMENRNTMESVATGAGEVSSSSKELRQMTERFNVERNEMQKIFTKEI